MRIAGDGEPTEGGENVPGQRLKFRVKFEEAFSEERVKLLTCAPVANRKDPAKVIRPRGADVHQRDDLLSDELLRDVLIRRGVHARQFGRDFDAQIPGQRHTDHDVARVNLMTQPHRFDFTVAVDSVANPHHRVGEIDEPRLGAGLFHVARDLQDGADVARRVRESARAAVLCVRLAHTVFHGNLKIPAPQIFARADLNRIDDELRAVERLAMIRVRADSESCLPLNV